MKLDYLANINNFLKKTNTDHQVRHFSHELVKKFKSMMRRQNVTKDDYSKIFDDEETIKRIRADMKKSFITPDGFNNKKSKKSL